MRYCGLGLHLSAKWISYNFGQGFGNGVGFPSIQQTRKKRLTDNRLAYFWGLIFAIYLMGHGLVAVPRRLLQNAKTSQRLRIIQGHAPKLHERLMDAIASLEELELQVTKLRQRKNGISRDHQDWIEEIADGSNLPESRLTSNSTSTSAIAVPAVITDRYLAGLARKLNRARHKRLRFIDAWDRLVQNAVDTQAVLDASSSRRLDLGQPAPYDSLFGRLRFLTPHARYVVYSQVVPAARISLGIVLALASICIIWSEIVKHVAPKLSIIRFTIVTHRGVEDGKVHFAGQVMASLWISYMCTAALASFGDIKVWGNRALVPRNTYGESATWYSGQIAKLTVPLAYNFLTFLPPTRHQGTMFYKLLGSSINLTPLGKGFDFFFPMFILIPACATFFNLYGRIKSVFSFDFVEDDDGNMPISGPGGWREGKALIDRELNAPSRLGLSDRSDRASSPLRSGHESPIGGNWGNGSFSSSQSTSGRISTLDEQQAQRLNAATRAAEEEDENFFQGFAHRVRNTFDTMDRPDWMNDLGKRPKWMGRINGNSEGDGRAETGRGLGRWFGGRPADGRVRL